MYKGPWQIVECMTAQFGGRLSKGPQSRGWIYKVYSYVIGI